MFSPRQMSAIFVVALAVIAAAALAEAGALEPVISEAAIVPLFPQKERDLELDQGWLDLFCGGRALRARAACRIG
jgi:hypothetical protein